MQLSLLQIYKNATDSEKQRVVTYLQVLCQYIHDGKQHITAPEDLENAIERSKMEKTTDQSIAILKNLFCFAGIRNVAPSIDLSHTANENLASLMNMLGIPFSSIEPPLPPPHAQPPNVLGGQFPLVLAYLGCNLEVPRLPSLLDSYLASSLCRLRCEEVKRLFQQINTCLECLDSGSPPSIDPSVKDTLVALIPMHGYPALSLWKYAISTEDLRWFFTYLCNIERDCLGYTTRPNVSHLLLPLLAGGSMLRALEDVPDTVPDTSGRCEEHKCYQNHFQRARWTLPMVRILRLKTVDYCCERVFWNSLQSALGSRIQDDMDSTWTPAQLAFLRHFDSSLCLVQN